LTRLLRIALEQLLEAVVGRDSRLHHFRQRPFADRLGRDLEVAADVVLDEFLHVLGRFDREVVAHARGDQYLLDARHFAAAPEQAGQRRVVGIEVRADAGIRAGRTPARRLALAAPAGDAIHVGGRPTGVRDHAGEA